VEKKPKEKPLKNQQKGITDFNNSSVKGKGFKNLLGTNTGGVSVKVYLTTKKTKKPETVQLWEGEKT